MGKKILFVISMCLTEQFLIISVYAGTKLEGKMFVPGLVQLENKETTKAYGIMSGEAVTLLAGLTFLGLSNSEYSKYKDLTATASQEEFDTHYNNSNTYGTISIISLIGAVGIYAYSVWDAMNSKPVKKIPAKKKYRKKTKRYSLSFEPQGNGIALCARGNYE